MNQIVHARFNPFEAVTTSWQVEQGRTIAEIVAACPDVPDWFWFGGEVRINGDPVPRHLWDRVRPKPNRVDRPICITLHAVIHGGGKGSTKNILTTVAAIALVAGATLVSGGLLGPAGLGLLGASFAVGGIGANLLAGGLALGATFLLSTLTPPPIKANDQGRDATTNAGIGPNVVRLLEPLSAVLGRIGYSPLQMAPAFTTLEDETLWVHAVVGLAGYYDEALINTSLRINGVDIGEIPQAEVQIRPGSLGDTPITINDYTVIEERRGRILSNFTLASGNTVNLLHQDDPDRDLPQWQLFRTRGEADEIWIRLNWPGGISGDGGTQTTHVPYRIEIKERSSSTWLKMPTIHVLDLRQGRGTLRQEFKLIFGTPPGGPRVNHDETLSTWAAYSVTGNGQTFEYESESYFANSAPTDQIPVMTSGTTSGVTMTASSSLGVGAEPWRAANSSTTDYWGPANNSLPAWLKVDFGSAKTIKSFYIGLVSGFPTFAPRDFALEGSNDDSSWTTLTTVENMTNWGATEALWFQVGSPGSYRYYRLSISTNNGAANEGITIADFRLTLADSPGNDTTAIFASHVNLTRDGVEIYLDTATFPKGEYDVRVKRGLAVDFGEFTPGTYELNGSVTQANFFEYFDNSGTKQVRVQQSLMSSECLVEQLSTVEDVYPWDPSIHTKGVAMIAIRAPNLVIDSISAEFHSIVPIWSGGTWSTDAPSSNPAALRRHVLLGQENALALPGEILNEEQHQDFYEFCASEGHEFNAVIDGMSVLQVVQQVDGGGYGVMAFPSGQWGVIFEYDRSAEAPVQVFTPLNTRGLTVSLDFAKLPHAIRVEAFDEDDDWSLMSPEPIVHMDGYDVNTATRIEALSLPGFTDRAKAEARALFDLRQLYLRRAKYIFEIGIEGLVAEKGDLVGLNHDVISRYHDFARIKSIQTSGGNVTGLTLEAHVNLAVAEGEVDTAMSAVIQLKDHTVEIQAVNELTETDTVTFVTPFAIPADDILDVDCVVGFGLTVEETKRMVVFGIEYTDELNRRITLVDEAQGLHA